MKLPHSIRLVLSAAALIVLFACASATMRKTEPGPSDTDAASEFMTTSSGLQYRILRRSAQAKPQATDTVSVHYRGWLDNGKVFDSSYQRGKSTTFPLNQVVPGWTEGLQLVGEGGMIELRIPSELGYGSRSMGNTIPANSTLNFIVELEKIN